jgi:hypothetical protein
LLCIVVHSSPFFSILLHSSPFFSNPPAPPSLVPPRLLTTKGYHGAGARSGDTEAQQIHDALDAILATLEDTRINLREAFESFDRSSNGSISVAEFASLIKTLGGLGLTKRQIYRLASSMDADFDRTIRYNEFMEYFLVIWVERLRGLRR